MCSVDEFEIDIIWCLVLWIDSDTSHYNRNLIIKEITLKMADEWSKHIGDNNIVKVDQ
jgi:hypothetical protein